jgi:hypothetical protein
MISFTAYLKPMNPSFHAEKKACYKILESTDLIARYLLPHDADDPSDFVNSGYSQARLALRISLHGAAAKKHFIQSPWRFSVREGAQGSDKGEFNRRFDRLIPDLSGVAARKRERQRHQVNGQPHHAANDGDGPDNHQIHGHSLCCHIALSIVGHARPCKGWRGKP